MIEGAFEKIGGIRATSPACMRTEIIESLGLPGASTFASLTRTSSARAASRKAPDSALGKRARSKGAVSRTTHRPGARPSPR